MEQKSGTSGKIITACFFTLFCGTAFGMGLFVLQMIEQSPYPQYGPPLIIVLVPFGMGIFGLVVCLSVLFSSPKQTPLTPTYSPETIVYSGDYSVRPEFSEHKRSGRSIYQVPSVCPSCGAAISDEVVDWVGPLKAKCPYCNATIDAEEKRF
ncbi:hypothetical protein EU527_14165 [Candidatus Thorarchaeota archaeon]|nr:MAG: hypothetical protein EU527_14165 [Candidatus Thorarchaeota archaeon]